MKLYKNPARAEWEELTRRPVMETESLEQSVKKILQEVKQNGDEALRKFTKQYDKADVKEFAASADEFLGAQASLDPKLKAAILSARVNIETFHKTQLTEPPPVETMPGVL